LISLLYLLLNIAVILLVVAIIWWVLGLLGLAIDARVMKIGQVIVALIILIYIVSWLAGAIPARGIFGSAGNAMPGEFASRLLHPMINEGIRT
jgi:uncharacterized membrane protein YtjA (UPF0391 family)